MHCFCCDTHWSLWNNTVPCPTLSLLCYPQELSFFVHGNICFSSTCSWSTWPSGLIPTNTGLGMRLTIKGAILTAKLPQLCLDMMERHQCNMFGVYVHTCLWMYMYVHTCLCMYKYEQSTNCISFINRPKCYAESPICLMYMCSCEYMQVFSKLHHYVSVVWAHLCILRS